jgi:uncharacterized protein YukJ
MALRQYGVLAGRVVESRAEGGVDSPHFQIHLLAGTEHFRIAVNVLSQESPSELLYVAVEHLAHPLLDTLASVPDGFADVPSAGGGIALDYIRGNLFDRSLLRPMPATVPGPDNDLADKLDHFTSRAVADPNARMYAFGERWGPENGKPDKVFGFSPGNGVHDIHMNQGNDGRFVRDDGVWQDGGVLFHFPGSEQWVAVFLAFQSQSWHTDDTTGHALGPEDPHRSLRIVAALVNPRGPAPELETVTLVNPRAEAVDLHGWSLVDRLGHQVELEPAVLPPGDALRIPLSPEIQLGNRGGTLSLLDPEGLKVDGVAYTSQQAQQEGVSIVF